jgi:hypothetical protein
MSRLFLDRQPSNDAIYRFITNFETGRSLTGLISPLLGEVVRLRAGSLRLSAQGLRNIRTDEANDKFTLVVGGHAHACLSCLAEFVSPRVSWLRSIDATIDELLLDVEHPSELFERVLTAAAGDSISVDLSDRTTFLSICGGLRNSELSALGRCDLTVSNAVTRLLTQSSLGLDVSSEVAFIASHFSELSGEVESLPFELISEIISHQSLKTESEDPFVTLCVDGSNVSRRTAG